MPRFLLFFLLPLTLLFGFLAWADRTDVILRSTLAVQSVSLKQDESGNCLVIVCAQAHSADAGLTLEKCHGPIALAGQANTECQNFMGTRARNLFIAQERL